nr:MAG TPA: hypothetical protein [Caudoviricetes sp.]
MNIQLRRRTTYHLSRGGPICGACWSPIPAGDRYRRDTWRDGSHYWSILYCPQCRWMVQQVETYTQPDYGGPEAEHFEAWATAHPHTERARQWALRTFPET